MWPIKKAWYRTYQAVFRVLVCFLDWSEPERLEGPGAIKRLPALIQSKGVEKVLIVTDKGLMSLHLLDPLFEKLTEAGIQYTLYDGTQPNPTFDNIEDARSLYVENNWRRLFYGLRQGCRGASGAPEYTDSEDARRAEGAAQAAAFLCRSHHGGHWLRNNHRGRCHQPKNTRKICHKRSSPAPKICGA